MGEISKLTGREYKPFNYYGAPEADRVIVAMGSACEAIEETVDYLKSKGREGRSCQGSPLQTVLG